ncbi:hypothetical protein AB6A40_010678 [Gnathostoma spinigerum]|uniref:Uncharacterized protein n=1 Tax=Gnathostoma spinigerum TaxID=75299 RepID=A0ABD6EVI3_9BILA
MVSSAALQDELWREQRMKATGTMWFNSFLVLKLLVMRYRIDLPGDMEKATVDFDIMSFKGSVENEGHSITRRRKGKHICE